MAVAWYCRIRDKVVGPIAGQDLKAMVKSGQLSADSLVRQGTTGAWIKAARIQGLFGPPTAAAGGERMITPVPSSSVQDDFADLPNLADEPLRRGPISGAQASRRASVAGFPDAVGGKPSRSQMAGDDNWEEYKPLASKRREMSEYRVLGVAITAIGFGFAGICFGLFPLVPIVLGLAGIIMTLRVVTMASRDDSTAMGLCLIAGMLGAVASVWGLHTTLSNDQPVANLKRILGESTSGHTAPKENIKGPANPAAVPWFDASQEAAPVGDVLVQVSTVAVGPIEGLELRNAQGGSAKEPDETQSTFVMIQVRLKNKGDRKLDYLSWSGTTAEGEPPTLRDDLGSEYRRVALRQRPLPGQLVGMTSLYPGKILGDVLVFQRPVDSFKSLELTLPASAFGDGEIIHFRIPRSMVQIQGKAPKHVESGPLGQDAPEHPKGVAITPQGEEKPGTDDKASKDKSPESKPDDNESSDPVKEPEAGAPKAEGKKSATSDEPKPNTPSGLPEDGADPAGKAESPK